MARARSCRVPGECARTFARSCSHGRRDAEERNPRRSEAVCDVVGASRARIRFPATPGPGDDEIQAAASRVVDITPWALPLLLTVIVYAKQPPSPFIFLALLLSPPCCPALLPSSLASSRGVSFLALVSPPFPPRVPGHSSLPRGLQSPFIPFPRHPSCAKDVFSLLAVFPPFPDPNPVHLAVSSLHPAIPPLDTDDRLHVPFLEAR